MQHRHQILAADRMAQTMQMPMQVTVQIGKGLVSEGNLPFQHCRQKLPAAQALHLSFSKVKTALILCEDCVFCDPDEVQSTALMAGH